MAHPSKIDNLCASLRSYIDLNFRPGAKLPAERVLCKIMGCSSRTLGIAMRKLVEEKRIVRNTKGSFVWSEAFRLKSEEALTLLLPCSDFSFAGNSYSRLGNHLMIRGALTAAKKFQRRIITIPVTDSNDPDDINPMQLSQLGPESMVMFQSRWYEPLFPLFRERKCRLAFLNCGLYTPEMIPPGIDCFMTSYRSYTVGLFEKSLEWFAANGARRILAAVNAERMSIVGSYALLNAFLSRHAAELKLRSWPDKLNYLQLTDWLKQLYAEEKFDALLLCSDPYLSCDPEFDFYEQTSIPVSLPLLISESPLLNQARIAEHAGVIHIPAVRYCMEAAEFLLSGRHGVEHVKMEYVVETADQYNKNGFC